MPELSLPNLEQDVRDFYEKVGGKTFPGAPRLPGDKEFLQRLRLINEELTETIEAHTKGDLAGYADGLVDLTYIVIGTAMQSRIPFNECWKEVQRSNMSKVGGHFDNSGKYIKPPTYSPANIEKVLNATNPTDQG